MTLLRYLSLCENDLDASATLPTVLERRRRIRFLTVYSCLRIADADGQEGTTLSFGITHSTWPVRGGDSLTLAFETVEGTATSADYAAITTGSVTVPTVGTAETAAMAEIGVATFTDALVEEQEEFTVRVALPQGRAILARVTAEGTIRDGPPPPPPPEPPPPPPPPEPPPPPPPEPPPQEKPVASFRIEPAECSEELCIVFAGSRVTLTDTSTGSVDVRFWDLGDGATSTRPVVPHSWSAPGYYRVSLTVTGAGATSEATRTVLARPGPAERAGTCEPDEETLCLLNERFAVEMDWWTVLHGGESGRGKVAWEGTNESGMFRFFDPSNWEVLIKVLDGCAINEHVWVYGASATTLGYSIRVTDTVTGAAGEYRNMDGNRADAITDSTAFADICGSAFASRVAALAPDVVRADVFPTGAQRSATGPAAAGASTEEGGCVETEATLCLLGSRYEVSVDWETLAGETGQGLVLRPRTDDSGLFYFFNSPNWELLVKVLDGCWYNDRHWVFAASATDLGLDLLVRDTVTGAVKRYVKEPGAPAPAIADTGAFAEGCERR